MVSAFADGRAALERQRGVDPGAPFFASDDDLLQRVKLPELAGFPIVRVSAIGSTVEGANAEQWSGGVAEVQVGFQGMWFQVSRDGAFHDIHTHGNCSWSGVYIVQIDDHAAGFSTPSTGRRTESHGYTAHISRPWVAPSWTWATPTYNHRTSTWLRARPDTAVPAWLAHKAMPYAGELDRVIISFNVTIHGRAVISCTLRRH